MLTTEQLRALRTIRPDEPMAWLMVYPDGFTAVVHVCRAKAELFARQQKAMLLPLCVPESAL